MKKLCNEYGCRNLANIKERYCNEHKNQEVEDIRRWRKDYDYRHKDDKHKKFYKSKEWKRLREYILKRDNYMCAECIKVDKVTTCNTVHHLVEIREDFSKALDESNLVTICHDCHNKIHKRFTPPYT